MNYEGKTDLEINAMVTCEVFDCNWWEYSENGGDCAFYHCGVDGSGYYEQPVVDFCNNPSEAWTIILKYGISINFDGIDWEADVSWMGSGCDCRSYNNIEVHAGKPLRAAMICFLKMRDAEK